MFLPGATLLRVWDQGGMAIDANRGCLATLRSHGAAAAENHNEVLGCSRSAGGQKRGTED